MFRRGLAQALEQTNAKLLSFGVQIRRFQVLREEFTIDNGLLLANKSLNRAAITARYRHLIDDMFQHQADYPSKWMPELQESGLQGDGVNDLQSSSARHSGKPIMGHSDAASHDQDDTPAKGIEHAALSTRTGHNRNQFASYSREERYTSYSREPSPRAFTREASPRQYNYTPRKGQRLPQSVRLLDMDTGSSSLKVPTPRDRGRSGKRAPCMPDVREAREIRICRTIISAGAHVNVCTHAIQTQVPDSICCARYSPTFAAAQSSVLPYDKSAAVSSIVPVGSGPLGLPLGGANFDGFARSCTSNIVGRPPRPQATGTAKPRPGSYSSSAAPPQLHAKHPYSRPHTNQGARSNIMAQNADGEWAF